MSRVAGVLAGVPPRASLSGVHTQASSNDCGAMASPVTYKPTSSPPAHICPRHRSSFYAAFCHQCYPDAFIAGTKTSHHLKKPTSFSWLLNDKIWRLRAMRR